MKKSFLILLCVFCIGNSGFPQGNFLIQNHKKSDKIKFRLINSLIVIPVEVNGIALSFLLDTGVSKSMIFNHLNMSDTLKIKDTETIYLKGLGGGASVEALKLKNNILKIGDAINLNQDLYAIFNKDFSFVPRLGIPVNGIIGFDLFRDLVVEINYTNKYIRLTEPKGFEYKKCKKCETFNLEFYNNKPYINTKIKTNKQEIPIKLLIDTGGSDDLWLFENDSLGLLINENHFNDFLGHGLSGSVYGKRSKIEAFYLKSFILKNANVAFPDAASIDVSKIIKGRNGSMCGGILKRFNIIVNYQKGLITFKKSRYFNTEFTYNKSGIELAHNGVHFVKELDNQINRSQTSKGIDDSHDRSIIILGNGYKLSLRSSYCIVELRSDSPAQKAGLKIGDVILVVNGSPCHQYTLQQITQKFYEEAGKQIKLKILRDGKEMFFSFKLQNVLK